jgi:hypothetical protein
MPVRRRVPSFVVGLLALMTMALGAPAANAVSLDTVTGGQTALFVPLTNVQKLAADNVYVSPISPAFLTFNSLAEGPALRFPIKDGAVESSTMLGTVNHPGGLLIQKFNADGTVANELNVTQPKLVAGASLVGNALDLVPVPTALLVNTSHSKDASTGVIHFEADAQVDPVTATVLNTYFNTNVFEPNMILGRVKANIETESILGL